ncbi:chitin synthase ChsE [Myxozyma melibiosi]|uniref:chitin synthase n=1 Tax=Myxozyma melibiosi TaxID=54550 RepID=A0ABR1FB90_9ASCO
MPPVADVSQLSAAALSDHSITAHLGARFHAGHPVSFISSNSLIAINTFSSSDPRDVSDLASRVYDRLLRRSENQLILFLGESGSGKSELRNHLCARLHTLALDSLAARISSALFVFSAFTTTKTQTTPVASKSGLLLEYQYDPEAVLIGAKLITYRLDRDRVGRVPTGERNFHILYYLLAGTTAPEQEHLALDPEERYRYLGHPTQLKTAINDKEGFAHFKSALRLLDFDRHEIAELCQILAAILHIGQLEFVTAHADVDADENHATIKNKWQLDIIAAFLGVRPDDLEASLVYKTQAFKRERVTLVLDHNAARAHADDLARTIYAMTEQWLIEMINDRVAQDESLIANTISVVDFPGFVPQEFGSARVSGPEALNQLLYNTANESLYNYMVFAFFHRMTEKFEAEELDIPGIEYFDNTSTVALLTKPHVGILPLLDDNTRRGKPTAAVTESMRKRFATNPSLSISPQGNSFVVRHYAGEVNYSLESILEANQDEISGDMMNLFSSTSSVFFRGLCRTKAVVAIKHPRERDTIMQGQLSSKPLRQPSVLRKTQTETTAPNQPHADREQKAYTASGQFNNALDVMRRSFATVNPYFIHCIKPNDRHVTGQFDVKCVRQQVHALGISDIARRVQVTDVSLFMSFTEVLGLSGFDDDSNMLASDEEKVRQVMMEHSWGDRDVKIGTTGVFLSEVAWRELVDPNSTYQYNNGLAGNPNAPTRGNPFSDSTDKLGTGAGAYIYSDPDKSRSTDALTVGTGVGAGGQGDMFKNFETREELAERGKANHEEEIETIKTTRARRRWMGLVMFLTWWLPDGVIRVVGRMSRKDIRVAWREKLAINMLIWIACLLAVFFIVGFPAALCPTQHVFSETELTAYNYDDEPSKTYVAIRGEVFDLSKFGPGHYPLIVSKSDVYDYGGSDATTLFPVQVSALCQGTSGSIDPAVTLDYTGSNSTDENAVYHDFRYYTDDYRPDWYFEMMQNFRKNYKKGDIGITKKKMKTYVNDDSRVLASIHGNIYEFTDYLAGGRQVLEPDGAESSDDVDTDFMDSSVVNLFESYAGSDITKKWLELDLDSDMRQRMEVCLRNLFYVGKVDTRNSVKCRFSEYFLLVISLFMVAIILVKFVSALQFSRKKTPEDLDNFIICQVPAYTEDETSLRRAIDSLATMQYDDKRKLLFIICDGMIVGAGNDRPTPRIVLDILGVSPDIDPEPLSFESLGEGLKQHNMGKIYSGLYEVQGHIVPFVVVVKVGKPSEISRPGNRGKRDSQMLLMRFLNRVHYNSPMNPLELELYHQIRNVIGVSPTYYEYILQVDADTAVNPDSATRMVSGFLANTKVIGLCGETALANSKQSIITMIQVYEYYISHNLAKAFESLFGSVTCLPGCFSMFRIRTAESGKPLFVSNAVVEGYAEIRVDTLHMKNLLHLGEDRYLSTLLLRHHPTYKTKFLSHAGCKTVAPDSWRVLVSQRRRWINSTVHNLVELAPMSQLCGFCCFSMRFIVILDLFSTLIQPVTVGYLVYLIYKLATDKSAIAWTSILMLVAVYGLQALIFLLRRKWDMIGWMIFYLAAIPVFSLALPIYSFWHMDDFSWGNTRVVLGEKGQQILISDEGKFDPNSIPRKRWEDFQAELWDQYERQTMAGDVKSEVTSFRGGPASYYNPTPSEYNLDNRSMARSVSPASRMSRQVSAIPPEYVPGSPRPQSNRGSVYFAQPSMPMPGGEVEMGVIDLPSDDMLLTEIREIIRTSDLMTITKKGIRLELERRFGGVSLLSKRDYINSATDAILVGEL